MNMIKGQVSHTIHNMILSSPHEWLEGTPKQPSWTFLLLIIILVDVDMVSCCMRQAKNCQNTEASTEGAIEGYFQKKPKYIDIDERHKKDCFPKEAQDAKCMNGGKCFVIEVLYPNSDGIVKTVACHCLPDFEGKRCELQALDPRLLPVQEECEGSNNKDIIIIVSSSLGAIFFLILVFCGARYLYKRHKRHKRLSCRVEDGNHYPNGKVAKVVDRNQNNDCALEMDPLTKSET